MSAAARKPVMAASVEPIRLDAHRSRRRRVRPGMLKLAAVFAILLLGILGSFADSALARSGLLLIGDNAGDLDNIATTLIWATVANIAACAGVVMIIYWFLSRPTGEVVELRPRWRRKH